MITVKADPTLSFSRETITVELFNEAYPLLQRHYEEIAQFKESPLDIKLDGYLQAEEFGFIRCYIARKNGVLVGYSSYFVRNHPHFQNLRQALSDILYISPEHRGFGLSFIKWCADQLRAEGIQRMYQAVNPEHNFSSMLERIGFELSDITYSQRLN